jgi:hypothetical protein
MPSASERMPADENGEDRLDVNQFPDRSIDARQSA